MIEQTSLAKLQKALDLFIKEYNDYLDLTEKILPGQSEETQEFVVSMLESLRIDNLNLNRLVELFSVFAASQKEQTLRKRLEELEERVHCVKCPKCGEVVFNTQLARTNHLLNYHDSVPYSEWEKVEWKKLVYLDTVKEAFVGSSDKKLHQETRPKP